MCNILMCGQTKYKCVRCLGFFAVDDIVDVFDNMFYCKECYINIMQSIGNIPCKCDICIFNIKTEGGDKQ